MLRVRIARSYLLAGALCAVHVASAACAIVYLPPIGAVAVVLVLGASLVFHLRRDALLLAPDAIVEAAFAEDGACEMHMRSGGETGARLLGSTFVSIPLIVINLACDGGRRRSVVLLADSADGETRRALRVWLRHGVRLEKTPSAGP